MPRDPQRVLQELTFKNVSISSGVENKAQLYLAYGKHLMQLDQKNSAIKYFDKAWNLDNSLSSTVSDLKSSCLQNTKDHQEPTSEFTAALTTNISKAQILQSLGKYHEAINYYKEELNNYANTGGNAKLSMIYYYIASCYERLGDYKSSLEDALEAIIVDNNNLRAFYIAGYNLLKLEDINQAAPFFDRIIAFYDDISLDSKEKTLLSSANYIKAIEIRDENLEGSLKHFAQIIELNPEDDEVYNKIAETLIIHGECKQALMFCDKALELNPSNLDAYHEKGISLLTLGDYEESIKYFKDYVNNLEKSNPNSPSYLEAWCYGSIAAAYCHMGNLRESLNYLNTAIEIQPNNYDFIEKKVLILKSQGSEQEAGEVLKEFEENYYNPGNFTGQGSFPELSMQELYDLQGVACATQESNLETAV